MSHMSSIYQSEFDRYQMELNTRRMQMEHEYAMKYGGAMPLAATSCGSVGEAAKKEPEPSNKKLLLLEEDL